MRKVHVKHAGPAPALGGGTRDVLLLLGCCLAVGLAFLVLALEAI
jgi:hypothetical protein